MGWGELLFFSFSCNIHHMTLLRIFLLLPLFLFAADGEDLRFSDVKALMNQVFSQHIDHKKISTEIISQSFWNFINQFDPDKIYLLESEVRPWVQKDDLEWMQIMSAYKKNEFGSYSELNKVIQDSIVRSRQIRSRLYELPGHLFSLTAQPLQENFSVNIHDLQDQIQDLIVSFIAKQKERFGEEAVMKKQASILEKFEQKMRAMETPYLFVNSAGSPLSESQQESLLVLHILKSLAKSLDSHTAFIDKTEAYDMKVRLEKGGTLGVGLVLEDGLEGVVVEETVPDSPAGRTDKIQKGDRIIAINDKVVKDRSLNEVTDILHLDDKGSVKLSFERESGLTAPTRYSVSLKKEPIPAQETRVDVSYTYFGEGIIGVIALHSFYDGEGGSSEKDVRDAISRLEQIAPLEGLILDLRDNRGGYLTQAVKVAGLFITKGVVAISRFSDGSEKIYRDIEGSTSFEGPLLILVSRETASAAEIVAQALQDYGVAVVAGDDHTFGKGTIQSQTVTEGTGAVYFKVTVGKYYTVSGKTPEEKGVKSNIVIPGPTTVDGETSGLQEISISPDTVEPEYLDDLSDVKPDAKPWFLKYYIPKLQPPEDRWNKILPQLVKNSQDRIKENKNYQLLLKKKSSNEPEEPSEEEEDEGFLLKRPQNSGVNDLQLDEAVQVMRDMIWMEDGEK